MQFIGEDAAARSVLRERVRALPVEREEQHFLPVRFFAPRIQIEPARDEPQCRSTFAARGVIRDQRLQNLTRALLPAFAFDDEPGFKLGAIVQKKARHKFAAIQFERGGERSRIAARTQFVERARVKPVRFGDLKLDGVARDVQASGE